MQIELHPNQIPEDLKKYFRPKRKYGPFILRNVIVWKKPNCMPSSIKDRFTIDFEYVFFFVKNKKYWFETQYESYAKNSDMAYRKKLRLGRKYGVKRPYTDNQPLSYGDSAKINPKGKHKRAVWTITTKPFKEAHFAVYPEELCEVPINAGCPEFICNKCGKPREKMFNHKVPKMGIDLPVSNTTKIEIANNLSKNSSLRIKGGDNYTKWKEENPDEFLGYTSCSCNVGFSGGIVLDPFIGSGTTGLVALKQNKRFIGIELNPEYIEIANERLKPYLEQTKLKNGNNK